MIWSGGALFYTCTNMTFMEESSEENLSCVLTTKFTVHRYRDTQMRTYTLREQRETERINVAGLFVWLHQGSAYLS